MSILREDVDGGRFDRDGDIPIPEPTPGEILLEEFMRPYGLSATKLAHELGVPTNRVTAIVNGTRSITADTALRLGKRFGQSGEFWMNLQTGYDLQMARRRHAEAAA